MKKLSMLVGLWSMLIIGFLSGCSGNQPTSPANPSPPVPAPEASSEPPPSPSAPIAEKDAIRERIDKMTLEEKIGQMIIAGVQGTSASSEDERMIKEQHVGGIIFYKNNLSDPSSVVRFANQLKQWNESHSVPLLLTVDQEGGRVSRLPGLDLLPTAQEIGQWNNREAAGEIGAILGEELKGMGLNMNFAPVLDINNNPKNPVIGDRSFGSTAEIVSSMGIEVMKKMKQTGVIPVVKHFPGHGDTETDSHLDLPVIHKSEKDLTQLEWKPFASAIEEGADAVMVAHILFPQIDEQYPSSLSRAVVTGQLRDKLGFEGVILTDDLTMGAIVNRYGIGEASVLSVQAGTDIVLIAHEYSNVDKVIAALKQSVADGTLSEERIDESVRRILQLKTKFNLEDKPVDPPDLTLLNERISKAIDTYRIQ
ncbi:beta-N-acetylhexosaminidase [Brevibacillus ruminantium]|uniref:beta-N-acetylhexosaminidase n=1 Tax=Brevibacillus ruminantium TaxID=2950604 RepID=A0ABY4WJU0_9BACL|nr:beta-N-acetylhexosaminidase [Brevibacillus ruminantium]USG66428.1 beta-N-acetylhexosaminidase [Brevibacillus ruminantium]